MQKLFLAFSIIFFTCLNASAQDAYEYNRNILLTGDVDALIKTMESEKDFNWDKSKISLNKKNSDIFSAALIIIGDTEKARIFLEHAIQEHPKDQLLKNRLKHLDFFEEKYNNEQLKYSDKEHAHMALIELFPDYLEHRDSKNTGDSKDLKNSLLKAVEDTDNRTPYFPTKLEYLLELDEKDSLLKAKKEALKIIEKHRKTLFTKTLDFYELAVAYRSLAIINFREGSKGIAEKYFRLALINIAKMRPMWLEEDLIIGTLLPKRQTKIGCVLPQWIMNARAQFESEYELLLKETQTKNDSGIID